MLLLLLLLYYYYYFIILLFYYLLFIIYYLLFIIYYLLFIIYYLLFIIYYLLFIIYYLLLLLLLLLLGDMPYNGISPIVSVRIFIYLFIYYCRNFVARLSQKRTVQSSSNFLSIFGLIWNREPPLFSLITQP